MLANRIPKSRPNVLPQSNHNAHSIGVSFLFLTTFWAAPLFHSSIPFLQTDFLTGDAASLLREAARARLRARLDFCAILASLFNCSLALITSASSVDTFLPSITRKPGVAGMLRAAAAAAERRVTRGVETILKRSVLVVALVWCFVLRVQECFLLGRHGCAGKESYVGWFRIKWVWFCQWIRLCIFRKRLLDSNDMWK